MLSRLNNEFEPIRQDVGELELSKMYVEAWSLRLQEVKVLQIAFEHARVLMAAFELVKE